MKRTDQTKGVLILSVLLLILWQFPMIWYAGGGDEVDYIWFATNDSILGWSYEAAPVGEAAEAILVADMMINGSFESESEPLVRVFSAKRFEEKENAVGLFSHTPDRCWTNTGMVIENVEPFFLEIELHGINMLLERRVFRFGEQRELAYFGALVGGEALPYRMDQYLGAGLRKHAESLSDRQGAIGRLVSARVWGWALESFARRTRLAGPQQLVRVSTPIEGPIEVADTRLRSVLEKWLEPVSYEQERQKFEELRENDA